MFKRLIPLTLLIAALVTLIPSAAAQDSQPERVEIQAADGLTLVGLYYAPPTDAEGDTPAVLLQHHGGSRKESWIDFIPLLLDAGYGVLTVDLRGHGETGGAGDWDDYESDGLLWLAWLREQPGIDPDRIALVGASLGGDVGMPIFAQDERLTTIVAISPLLNVDGLSTLDAVQAAGDRPMYFIAGQGVEGEAEAVRTLFAATQGNAQARLYDSGACCTFLIMMENDLGPSIIDWLNLYN